MTTSALTTAAIAAATVFWATPAGALVDVRFERWTQFSRTVPRDVVAPVESVVTFIVEFDATATAGAKPMSGADAR